jgi:hypothetical protein
VQDRRFGLRCISLRRRYRLVHCGKAQGRGPDLAPRVACDDAPHPIIPLAHESCYKSPSIHVRKRELSMYRIRNALLLAALVLPISAFSDNHKTDPTGCDNVNWSDEVLKAFPNAKRGCQKIVMKDEVVYAQYKAEVVSGDKEGVTIHMKDHDGKNMTKIKLAPSDDVVQVNGKDTKFRDLQKGTELRFYVPHNRWGLYSAPGGRALEILSSEPM